MYVEFENLPDHSRVWVYTLDKVINSEARNWLESSLKGFLEKWTAHGNDLKSGFRILYDAILVIGLDEGFSNASGCSIDASVHFLKGAGSNLNIDFFNRQLIPFYLENKIMRVPMEELKERIEKEEINGDSLLFNTMAGTVQELKGKEFIPVRESWLKRYLKYQKVD